MSDLLIFVGALVSVALTVGWVLSMVATMRLREDVIAMRASLTRVLETQQAALHIVNERHQWDAHERRRALRLKALMDHGVEEEDAIATVDRELPIT